MCACVASAVVLIRGGKGLIVTPSCHSLHLPHFPLPFMRRCARFTGERDYDHKRFDNRVDNCPIDDHNVPLMR